jgi:hypothetical protein
MTAAGVDDVLVALADATRRQVLHVLPGRGEATATTLAAEPPVTRQAVVWTTPRAGWPAWPPSGTPG